MRYHNAEKAKAAINSNFFKKLDHVNDVLLEVELVKAQIEHKEPIFVRLFILQYAKLRTMKLYYNFFTKFYDVKNFEELGMDTNWLYLALAEKELEDCIQLEMVAEWKQLRSKDGTDCFTAHSVGIFLRKCCDKHKEHKKWEPHVFKDEFRCSPMLCIRS